jgi:hypothetical protein
MIRPLSTPNSGLLNHPNVAMMRAQSSRCKAIILVDDLVGSGSRAAGYLTSLWENRTIRSWWSRNDIKFFVVSFAATEEGEKRLRNLKCSPSVIYDRVCPTLRSLPWSQKLKSEVSDLCEVYGSRTSKPTFWSGYQRISGHNSFRTWMPKQRAVYIVGASKQKVLVAFTVSGTFSSPARRFCIPSRDPAA